MRIKIHDIIKVLAYRGICIKIDSGLEDSINGYGHRCFVFLKITHIQEICVKCGPKQQDYKGEKHNSNCQWRRKETELFNDKIPIEGLYHTLYKIWKKNV